MRNTLLIAALTATGLFAAAPVAPRATAPHNQFLNKIETVLSMTPAQKDQTRTTFDAARQAAQPVRQELRRTNHELAAAIRADDTAKVQQLSTTEGNEIGQLAAIRNQAMAKIYKTLTPDQRQRADALHAILMRGFHEHAPGASHMAS